MAPVSHLTKVGQTPAGQDIHAIDLHNDPLRARILTLGAIVQDLRLCGLGHSLVVGCEQLDRYYCDMRYVGALVGRYANRIAQGRFEVNGTRYQLSQNAPGCHCLHGGAEGSDVTLWTVQHLTQSQVHLHARLDDGHMGFPGALGVDCVIRLTDDAALEFDIQATTTAATPVSFAHHGYFNLAGSPDINDHQLEIAARHYVDMDAEGIPSGRLMDIVGSDIDFSQLTPIGSRSVDHNFCVAAARGAVQRVARLVSPRSGVTMTVETTEPGLQVYTGDHFTRSPARAGIALETQAWPDAPNQPGFPNAILRPDEVYHSTTRYRFDPI